LNIKEYISSGIIESYVLGLATEEEVSILECVRKNSPEVQQAILDAQLLIEQLASREAIVPNEELKSTIWDRLSTTSDEDNTSSERSYAPAENEMAETLKPLSLPPTKKWNPLSVAATVILVLSLASNAILLTYRDRDLKKIQEVTASNDDSLEKLRQTNQRWEMIQRKSVKTITLQGVEKFPNVKAVVFWDTQTSDVFLAAANLPVAPSGRQYQLWAIVDGQPVDAGLLPLSPAESLLEMDHISKAEAFAITLENEGGSAVPTLSEMYVIGNI